MLRRLLLLAGPGLVAALALTLAWQAGRPQSAHALTNCETSTAALDASEQEFFDLINAFRVANGRSPLAVSPNLSRAAAWMAEDLASHSYWDHDDSLGRSPFQRVIDCGYPSMGVGENLAMAGSAAMAVSLFEGSPGHHANMLNANWTVMGTGHAGPYWVVDFGAANDSSGDGGGSQPTPVPTQQTAAPTQPGSLATPPAGGGTQPPVQSPTVPTPTASPTPVPAAPTPRPIVPRLSVAMLAVE